MNGKATDATEYPDEVEVEDLDEVLEVIPYNFAITAYGADYPVDSLVKRILNEDIFVPTFGWSDEGSEVVGFQREYVWTRPKADRFIESLLLGLPVPGIFLVKEKSGRLLVLDGHQRLVTLRAFYEGIIGGGEYRLSNVQARFEGKRYKDLDVEDRRRLDDSIIHATVVRQDEPTEDQSSIYMIFERLNTGGMNLQPQEIRVALYHGEFVRILKELNDDRAWRELFGAKSRRLKDLELILRFFAFYYYQEQYDAPMKDFLNRYMASNRDLTRQGKPELTRVFSNTVGTILSAIGPKAFKPKRAINAAVVDSVMTGVARRLATGDVQEPAALASAFKELMSDDEYVSATETGTSQPANVSTRMKLATEAFERVT